MTRRDILKLLRGNAAAGAVLPALKSVERLEVKPEDTIVLKFDDHLSHANIEQIRESFRTAYDGKFKDMPVLILDGGADISILRKTIS